MNHMSELSSTNRRQEDWELELSALIAYKALQSVWFYGGLASCRGVDVVNLENIQSLWNLAIVQLTSLMIVRE